MAPPICIVGPSRPPEPPEPRVKIEARPFTQGTRRRTIPASLWNASMIASAPPPRVSGASREIAPPTSAPAAGISQRSHGRNGVGARVDEDLARRLERQVPGEPLEELR